MFLLAPCMLVMRAKVANANIFIMHARDLKQGLKQGLTLGKMQATRATQSKARLL